MRIHRIAACLFVQAASVCSAQSVHPYINGFDFSGGYHYEVLEAPEQRELGTVDCPYSCSSDTATVYTAEFVFYDLEENPWCFWGLEAYDTADNTLVCVPAELVSSLWILDGKDILFSKESVVWDSCDMNLDGTFNIYDYVSFLNAYPHIDYNGDGSANILDYGAFLNECGG